MNLSRIAPKTISVSKITINSIAIVLLAYLFIATFRFPVPQCSQLDPSWCYGLVNAVDIGLRFGEDIIFTCGPWSHLVVNELSDPDLLLQATLFRLAVHFVYFFFGFRLLYGLSSNWHRFLGICSLFLPFLLGIFFEYEVVFSYILALASLIKTEGRWRAFVMLCFGATAGFLMLTKFTIGFLAVMACGAVCGGEIIAHRDLLRPWRRSWTQALTALWGLTFAHAAMLHPADSATRVLWIFAATILSYGIAKLVIAAIRRLQQRHEENIRPSRMIHSFRQSESQACSAALLTGAATALFLPSDAPAQFILGSLALSSGFSAALSQTGPRWELALAFLSLLVVATWAFCLYRSKSWTWLLILSAGSYLSFKHGFVRQDLHTLNFFRMIPFFGLLSLLAVTNLRDRKLIAWGMAFALSVAIIVGVKHRRQLKDYPRSLLPAQAASNLYNLINQEELFKKHTILLESDLATMKLKPETVELLRAKSLCILPHEFSVARANSLSWKPIHTLQSFSAFTASLDQRSALSLSREAPDYILFHNDGIDGRHPLLDAPAVTRYIVQNYQAVGHDTYPVSNALKNGFHILKYKPHSHMIPKTLQTDRIRWNEARPLPHAENRLLFVECDFETTLLGRAVGFLFRRPAVFVDVMDSEDAWQSYRISPANASNGLLLSHVSDSQKQISSLFNNEATSANRSFRLRTQRPSYYQPEIKIRVVVFDTSE